MWREFATPSPPGYIFVRSSHNGRVRRDTRGRLRQEAAGRSQNGKDKA